jgi:hypothetical protein
MRERQSFISGLKSRRIGAVALGAAIFVAPAMASAPRQAGR